MNSPDQDHYIPAPIPLSRLINLATRLDREDRDALRKALDTADEDEDESEAEEQGREDDANWGEYKSR